MSRHALRVLEFSRVLECVAGRAASEEGRRRILRLEPGRDRERLAGELERVAAVMRFVERQGGWGMPTVPEAEGPLQQLTADGAVLDPLQLHSLGTLLTSSRLVADALDSQDEESLPLWAVTDRLYADPDAERALLRSVDAEGTVLDTASSDLKSIRGRLRGAHARVVRRLETYMKSLPERFMVPDASVTVREGRYVLPVRREGRGEVGGVVHDESQSGATLFVEPPMAMELMGQLRDLERDEAREIRRVLGALSDRLAPSRDALAGSLDALIDFDTLHARARSALAWRASVPTFGSVGSREIHIVQGSHPLLLEEADEAVVPFDLELTSEQRVLVVTGPNTGGKSVFLKATGLISALAQSGVVPPVGDGTVLPIFGSFFADIGDEQSIEQNLSTFSAHLGNLADIVSRADRGSLVLIDEMGTGTDPAEGAALSRAVLEHLVSRGALALVSTHLGELRRLDGEGTGIVNASLQFDDERMQPTFRLVKGRPGRSYGLVIARRLGFPAEVLDRAEAFREGGEASMEDLLGRLERYEREAEERSFQLDLAESRTGRMREDVEAREGALRQAERTAAQRAEAQARQLLLDARAEVEEAIRELKASARGEEELAAASWRARRRVEDAAAAAVHVPETRPRRTAGIAPAVGDRVRVHATGAKGTVTEIRADRAMVEAGALRMEMPLADLEPLGADSSPQAGKPRGRWKPPGGGQAKLEVDLRGLRVDELDLELARALDQAVFEDLEQLRIIHGKGTGALRQRVGEFLKLDGRVRAFRMGGPTEGGAGVTVATFRGAAS